MLRAVQLGVHLGVAALVVSCLPDAPRVQVVRARVHAGERVLVRLDPPSSRPDGELWLTLVPAGAPESSVGERVELERGAAQAAVTAPARGVFEIRLHDRSLARPDDVVDRTRVDVGDAVAARRDPPVWYW